MGRWSFIGVRPRSVLRWSLGDPGDPYALAAEHVARFRQAPLADPAIGLRSPAARWASSVMTWCAPSSRWARVGPDPLGLPDMALMLSDALVIFDHLKHTVTILVNVEVDAGMEPGRRDRARTRRPRERSPRSAQALDGPVPHAERVRAAPRADAAL